MSTDSHREVCEALTKSPLKGSGGGLQTPLLGGEISEPDVIDGCGDMYGPFRSISKDQSKSHDVSDASLKDGLLIKARMSLMRVPGGSWGFLGVGCGKTQLYNLSEKVPCDHSRTVAFWLERKAFPATSLALGHIQSGIRRTSKINVD
jgi:hypothetical protein